MPISGLGLTNYRRPPAAARRNSLLDECQNDCSVEQGQAMKALLSSPRACKLLYSGRKGWQEGQKRSWKRGSFGRDRLVHLDCGVDSQTHPYIRTDHTS
jgi:hypothetical protein